MPTSPAARTSEAVGAAEIGPVVRRRVRVRGVVQGVGFRPFVFRLASELTLTGRVGNDNEGVLVEIEGRASAVADFEARLVAEAPSLARIDTVEVGTVAPLGEPEFRIVESPASASAPAPAPAAARTFVAPDSAVCDDCRREVLDPGDRRYRYPFINCTNCGPRFTITVRLPYDRPNTTMRTFPMCAECRAEYDDPADRRFHAQPIACVACGPRQWFEGHAGVVHGADAAIVAAQRAIADGRIVAIKGLGGYHLACDARSASAVARLRRRKRRPDKPLAVMVVDVESARRIASVDDDEAALLTGAGRPIVLLHRRHDGDLAPGVAPANPFVGVLLAYTPLHHLLFREVPGSDAPVPEALVMTSGNLSDEPICFDDEEARRRLGAIADAWLLHDRPIHVPCDDSVVRVVNGLELPIRRSRGFAPVPIRLPFDVPPMLAVGGELKNTFCLASGRDAWMSQHIGDMGSLETLDAFERSTRQFAAMYQVDVEVVAADAHPGYHTRAWAERQTGTEAVSVHHHHAHVAAVMVEHGLRSTDAVIGFAFDGTGFGTDRAIWGGEVFVGGYAHLERVRHLRYVSLPGGDATIRKPYRSALAHLWAADVDWQPDLPPVQAAPPSERAVLARQLERGVHCVPSSSMGRLFDAVSALVGVRAVVSYEAQAATELEAIAAASSDRPREYRFGTEGGGIDAAPVMRAIGDDPPDGIGVGTIAAGFHVAVAQLVADTASALRDQTGFDRVALSGGVFQNALLVRLATVALEECGLRVLTHRLVPPNDGGLALGQIAVAAHRRRRSTNRQVAR
jgi:hydrogenase maturation protein HypF